MVGASSFAIALISALILTPIVRWQARRFHLVDQPDPHRKLQQKAVPLGGGLAILFAALAGISAAVLGAGGFNNQARLLPLFLALLTIALVGLADDRFTLRVRQKLLGQLVAVGIVVYSGLVIRNIHVFEQYSDFSLGLLAVPFTIFWLLGAINALNLLDGADGFATTIGLITTTAIAIMAGLSGQPAEAAVAWALSGALLGFLFFNFPPASIYLGDSGSMLIGLSIGVLAIQTTLKGPATVAMASPLALLAIPIFDSAAACLRRLLTGRGLSSTDRGHLHHSLLQRGLGPRGLLLGISLLSAATALGALISVAMGNEMFAIGSVCIVVGVLIASRVFGFNELVLLASRTLAFGNSLMVRRSHRDGTVRHERVNLQGNQNWDRLWTALTDFAQRHGLYKVSMDLNAAWLHEGYNAMWERGGQREPSTAWMTKVPLMSDGRPFGRVEMSGALNGTTPYETLTLIAELLESLEVDLGILAAELTVAPDGPPPSAENGEGAIAEPDEPKQPVATNG